MSHYARSLFDGSKKWPSLGCPRLGSPSGVRRAAHARSLASKAASRGSRLWHRHAAPRFGRLRAPGRVGSKQLPPRLEAAVGSLVVVRPGSLEAARQCLRQVRVQVAQLSLGHRSATEPNPNPNQWLRLLGRRRRRGRKRGVGVGVEVEAESEVEVEAERGLSPKPDRTRVRAASRHLQHVGVHTVQPRLQLGGRVARKLAVYAASSCPIQAPAGCAPLHRLLRAARRVGPWLGGSARPRQRGRHSRLGRHDRGRQ